MSCSGLTMNAIINCDDPLAPGLGQKRLIGMNKADIESVTYDITDSEVITDITLKSGTQAWYIEGIKNTLLPSVELVDSPTTAAWIHRIGMSIFDVGSKQKLSIQGMANQETVWVVENSNDSSNGNSIFEVYGLERGMRAATVTRSPVDTESGAAYVIEVATPIVTILWPFL